MNNLKMLVALHVFAGGLIPWLALGVIAVVMLVMVVRDRYRRKLRLAVPAEAAEIEGLLRDGKITAAEVELLLRKCNALPEVEEVAPVPDLSLRLAAAVSRIYAVMMLLILLFQVLMFALVFWPVPQDASGFQLQLKVGVPSWDEIAFAVVLSLVLFVAAIVQYFASRRVLTGSGRARNWLIVSWLVFLVCLHQAFAARYWAPVAGLFVLWVLCWRSGAARKISSRAAVVPEWRKWALAVVALIAVWLGVCCGITYQGVTTQVMPSANETRGAMSARLERLHILCGTPEPEALEVARKTAARFQSMGIAVTVHEAGAIPVEINADRELVIWIGRGRAAGAAPEEANDPFPGPGLLPDTSKLLAGKPYYQVFSFDDSFCPFVWKGFFLPRFYREAEFKVAVSRDDNAAGTDAVAKSIFEYLEGTFEWFMGPEALLVPETPHPEPQAPWQAPELRDFRLMLRSRGTGGQFEVYAFTAGDEEADRKAVKALLERHGFRHSRDSTRNRTDYLGGYRGDAEARLYYWQLQEEREFNLFSSLTMELPTALLTVELIEPGDQSRDPEFAARFLKEDLTAFLCSRGLEQLDPAAREAALACFRALPEVPRKLRLRVLSEAMRCRDEWSEAGKTLLEEDFRALTAEVLAGGVSYRQKEDIDSLRSAAERTHWAHLQEWLQEQLGGCYRKFMLAGEPGDDGMIRAELKLPVAELRKCLFLVELDFGDSGYQPLPFWVGLFPIDNGKLYWWYGNTGSWIRSDAVKLPLTFFNKYVIENQSAKPPWKLWNSSLGVTNFEKTPPEPGGMTIEGVLDEMESALTLRFVFAPLRPEETAWQQRLNALPKGDPAMLELAKELLTRRERSGFLRQALELLQACGDAPRRQQVGEVLGEFYCRIALPAEADADGIHRAKLRHPVGSVADTRVICEIDAAAAGAAAGFCRLCKSPMREGKTVWGRGFCISRSAISNTI